MDPWPLTYSFWARLIYACARGCQEPPDSSQTLLFPPPLKTLLALSFLVLGLLDCTYTGFLSLALSVCQNPAQPLRYQAHEALQGQGSYSSTAEEGVEAQAGSITCPRTKSWNLGPEGQAADPGKGFPTVHLFYPTANLLFRDTSSAEAAVSTGLLLTLGDAGLGSSDSVLSREREGQQFKLGHLLEIWNPE